MGSSDRHYFVLYAQPDVNKVKNLLDKYLPGDKGETFIPYMEFYSRGYRQLKVRPIFPGYVFVYTELSLVDLHFILLKHRKELQMAVRELGFKEAIASDPERLQNMSEEEILDLSDISEEEEAFFDILREGGGVLAMSEGYEYNGRYVVMNGPLKAFEDQIVHLDKHNKKAFLKFEINDMVAQAGFECRPRAHWFPEEYSNIVKLGDGAEVDLEELKNNMLTH